MAIISGSTPLFFTNGRGALVKTRPAGREFNRRIKAYSVNLRTPVFYDEEGAIFVPSKGLEWDHVAEAIREGKKVQARLEGKKKST